MERILKSVFPCLLLLLLFSSVQGQRRLCEVNSFLYSQCFSLEDDGTFFYEYAHCTGVTAGMGRWIEKGKKLVFEFDSIPGTEVVPATEEVCSVKIKFTFIQRHSGERVEYVLGRNENGGAESDSLGRMDLKYGGSPFTFIHFDDTFFFDPGPLPRSEYEVKLGENGFYDYRVLEKVEMRKVGERYFYWDEGKAYLEKKNRNKRYRMKVWMGFG